MKEQILKALKKILLETKNAAISVGSIYALVMILVAARLVSFGGWVGILSFTLATVFVILGIALFNYGAETAMTPIGKKIGRGLTRQGNIVVLLLIVFLFGMLITVAEPDLAVLANQTASLVSRPVLIFAVGAGVGTFLVLSILKIVKKIRLTRLLMFFYLIAFGLMVLLLDNGKGAVIGLCFDSGGVTTGPMTVPFLMSLGAGVAAVLAKKSDQEASFGFIAFASIGPIIIVLLLMLFAKEGLNYSMSRYEVPDNFFLAFLHHMPSELQAVGLSIALLAGGYLFTDLLFLHSSWKTRGRLLGGLLFAFAGLVIFLSAVSSTYMGVGLKIGEELGDEAKGIALPILFVLGALTVAAEPAIHILNVQVEETTNGIIRKRSVLIALCIGVGTAIVLAATRIFYGFSLLYIIIPGYLLCFALSFFVPPLYTAIAFDAGGVASGPLTSGFILPLSLGLALKVHGEAGMLEFGFGIVSLVALAPLLSIEILGLVSKTKDALHSKQQIRQVLQKEDKVIFTFMQR